VNLQIDEREKNISSIRYGPKMIEEDRVLRKEGMDRKQKKNTRV
jgi:hypothetical protein